jgi:hypothetical protein
MQALGRTASMGEERRSVMNNTMWDGPFPR